MKNQSKSGGPGDQNAEGDFKPKVVLACSLSTQASWGFSFFRQ